MKGSILQLLIFLLLFVSLIVVFCFSGYLLWFDTGYGSGFQGTKDFFRIMPGLALGILPPVVLMAVVFSYLITVKKKVNRFLSSVLILAFSFVIYFGGFYGLIRISSSGNNEGVPVSGPVILEKKINPFDRAYVYADRIGFSYAYDVVTDTGVLTYRKSMDRKDLDSMVLTPGGSPWVSRLNANPYFGGIFRFSGFMEKFAADISMFNREMTALYNSSVYFFIIRIASQILFALSLWSFLKISRWPLMNVFMSLVLVRGVFAVYPLWNSGIIKSGLAFFPDNVLKDNSLSIALIAVSIVIFLIDGVISGLRQSRKDAVHG